MTPSMPLLIAAALAFVGTHFALSHPLRRPLVGALGPNGFLILYSVVAAVTLGGMAHVYAALPRQPLAYAPGDAGWGVATAVMWFASVLLAGSLIGNPALPGPVDARTEDAARVPRGVFGITRHPMMWGIALWALAHMYVNPTPASHVVSTAILVLALGGALGQDYRKRRALGAAWQNWEKRTSFVPFVAVLMGRVRAGDAVPGIVALVAGTALWLAATWAHGWLGGMAAGVWRWIA